MSLVLGLKKDYGDFQLDIPRWEISDAGVTALWGPSGSGKTSVFRLLIGLEPCPGLVWNFADFDLAQLPVSQRRLGVVFQSCEIFPHMTVRQNILFAAKSRGRNGQDAESDLNRLMSDLQLNNVASTQGSLLSGGERQRTALARALIGRPRFLLLDEPFSSLDSELRGRARKLVKNVIEHHQVPTLLVTHDETDVTELAQHRVRIANGKLLAD